jgi:hypothetical protein
MGTKSNRDGIGTKIILHFDDGSKKWQQVKGSSSYCSQNESIVTFGLGSNQHAKRVEVIWPSGTKQTLDNVKAKQLIVLKES